MLAQITTVIWSISRAKTAKKNCLSALENYLITTLLTLFVFQYWKPPENTPPNNEADTVHHFPSSSDFQAKDVAKEKIKSPKKRNLVRGLFSLTSFSSFLPIFFCRQNIFLFFSLTYHVLLKQCFGSRKRREYAKSVFPF